MWGRGAGAVQGVGEREGGRGGACLRGQKGKERGVGRASERGIIASRHSSLTQQKSPMEQWE